MTTLTYTANKHYEWTRTIFLSAADGRPVENPNSRGLALFIDGVPYSRMAYATARDIPWQHVTIDARSKGKKITFTVNNSTTPIPVDLEEFYTIKPPVKPTPIIPAQVKDTRPINMLAIKNQPTFPEDILNDFIPTEEVKQIKAFTNVKTARVMTYAVDRHYVWSLDLYKLNGKKPPVPSNVYHNIMISFDKGLFVALNDIDHHHKDIWEFLSALAGPVVFKFTSIKTELEIPSVLADKYRLDNNKDIYGTDCARYMIADVQYKWTKEIRDALGRPDTLFSANKRNRRILQLFIDGEHKAVFSPDPRTNATTSGAKAMHLTFNNLDIYLDAGHEVTFSSTTSTTVFLQAVFPFYATFYGIPEAIQDTIPKKYRMNDSQLLPLKSSSTQAFKSQGKSWKEVEKVATKTIAVSEINFTTKGPSVMPVKNQVTTPEELLKSFKRVVPTRYAYQPGVTYIWSKSAAELAKTPFVNELPSSVTLTVNKFLADPVSGRRYTNLVAKCNDWEAVNNTPKANLMYHFSVSESGIEVPASLIGHFENSYGYIFDEIKEIEYDYFYSTKEEYLWTPDLQEKLGSIGPFALQPHFNDVEVSFHTDETTAVSQTSLIDWTRIPEDVMVTFRVKEEIQIAKELEAILVPAFNEVTLIKKLV
jgi:hypothetical protein